MAKKKGKNPNIETNYYLQQRYADGELNTEAISFEPDTGSPIYSDHSQETINKKKYIEQLEVLISGNNTIVSIIDAIPLAIGKGNTKTVNLSVEQVNKIYSFCILSMKKDSVLEKLTRIEMFDLITDYLNLNEKEVKYFHRNLSITFKSELLEELKDQGLYKDNKLF